MADVVIGLGANVGVPEDNLRAAVTRLRDVVEVEAVSSLYRTEPVGPKNQPDFLNAVLAGSTAMEPRDLLAQLVKIEAEMGRRRDVPMGPRTLDLDLLLYEDRVLAEPGLEVPHPRMAERRFVLAPLAELAPGLVHPVLGRTVSELLAALPPGEAAERLVLEDWPPTRGR